MKENRDALRWVWDRTAPSHGRTYVLMILNLLISFGSVLFALITKRLIDSSVNFSGNDLLKYSAALIVLVIAQYSCSAWSNYLVEDVSVRNMKVLRSGLLACILNKDYGYVTGKHTGEWMNLLFSDVKIVAEGSASILPSLSGMASRLVCSSAALLFLEPLFGAAYLIAGVMILLGVTLLRGRLKKLHRDVQMREDEMHASFQELTENQMIIRAFSAQKHFAHRADEYQDAYSRSRMHRRIWRVISHISFSLTFRLGYVAALVWGGYRLLHGASSFGTLTAVLQLISQIQSPISGLSGILPRIYEVSASAERIRKPEEYADETDAGSLPDDFLELNVQDVSFFYDRETVLDHVSMEMKRGEIVGLCGISGGGKTTLFTLLLGLFHPRTGMIRILCRDGIYEPSKTVRSLFAYVPQGNMLVSGTIAENICFGLPYDAERMKEALHISEAESFVSALPEKEQTRLRERGHGLSEGQMQRVAVARAIYSQRPILLLDECTSALDTETEKKVLKNLQEMKDRTILFVTHRASALTVCDRQYVLEEGKIKEV